MISAQLGPWLRPVIGAFCRARPFLCGFLVRACVPTSFAAGASAATSDERWDREKYVGSVQVGSIAKTERGQGEWGSGASPCVIEAGALARVAQLDPGGSPPTGRAEGPATLRAGPVTNSVLIGRPAMELRNALGFRWSAMPSAGRPPSGDKQHPVAIGRTAVTGVARALVDLSLRSRCHGRQERDCGERKRRVRWAPSFSRTLAASLGLLVVLSGTSCAESDASTSSSRCEEFIHSGWEDRIAVLQQVQANQRTRPDAVTIPSVATVSMVCDAYPEITLAEAVGRATQGG